MESNLPSSAYWNPSTSISFEVIGIQVWPEKNGLSYVVGKVDWLIRFERNGCSSQGQVQTLLDPPLVGDNFININDVTESRLIAWALQQQGGDNFLRSLEQLHEPQLVMLEKQIGLVPWALNV